MCSFTPVVFAPTVCVGSPGMHWFFMLSYVLDCPLRKVPSLRCGCRFHQFLILWCWATVGYLCVSNSLVCLVTVIVPVSMCVGVILYLCLQTVEP
jgi:hypothetical protein